jgi:hypothetical protein
MTPDGGKNTPNNLAHFGKPLVAMCVQNVLKIKALKS